MSNLYTLPSRHRLDDPILAIPGPYIPPFSRGIVGIYYTKSILPLTNEDFFIKIRFTGMMDFDRTLTSIHMQDEQAF